LSLTRGYVDICGNVWSCWLVSASENELILFF